MAHPNIEERRQAVMEHYIEGGELTSEFKREMALKFTCSSHAIYADWLSITQSLYGGKAITTPILRKSITERDGGRCQYCGVTASPPIVEHVVPASQGGPTIEENLVCACAKCNARKKSRVWVPANLDEIASDEWATYVRTHAVHPAKRGAPKKLEGEARVNALVTDRQWLKLGLYKRAHKKTTSEAIRDAIDLLYDTTKLDAERKQQEKTK